MSKVSSRSNRGLGGAPAVDNTQQRGRFHGSEDFPHPLPLRVQWILTAATVPRQLAVARGRIQ